MNLPSIKKSTQFALATFAIGVSIIADSQAQDKTNNNVQPNDTRKGYENTIDLTKNKAQSAYSFSPTAKLACLPVEDQCRTSTCWSYSTLSMLESELIRLGKGQHNLSQMYVARWAYVEKAKMYLRMNGKHNFEQGGEGHDIPSIIKKYGIVPEEVYT